MNGINGNGSKVSTLFVQIIGGLLLVGITSGIVIYGTVRVLGERIDSRYLALDNRITQLFASQMETRSDTAEIRNNYIRRVETEPRFNRIENQLDVIYRDMARLEKKVE